MGTSLQDTLTSATAKVDEVPRPIDAIEPHLFADEVGHMSHVETRTVEIGILI